MQQDVNQMCELANADYLQHNPHIPTGLEPFIQMLPVLQQVKDLANSNTMFGF